MHKDQTQNPNYMSQTGRIIKGIGGFYYVLENDDDTYYKVYECRARGKFRLDGVAPRAGDHVRFEIQKGETQGGYLLEIYQRKNLLTRPPVANVDQFILVMSASKPKPDLLLADKLLIQAERRKVQPLIVLNKCDVGEEDLLEQIQCDYADLPYPFLLVSAKTGEGLQALRAKLNGKLSCLAGQSAVGKSSLINALCHSLELETGGISRKSGRGRHTTRSSSLMPLEGAVNSYIMDTPGFSLLDIDEMEVNELQQYYPEMLPYRGKCRFDDCLHQNEPDCAVKDAVKKGEISQGRYQRYQVILEELRAIDRNKYS